MFDHNVTKPDNLHTFGPSCELGEGPLWHPVRERLFWFDIPQGLLFSCDAAGAHRRQWAFGEPASAAGWIDRDHLLVATASGLQLLDLQTSRWETVADLEADNPVTRSNDGRTGPDGSFWIGTMGRGLENRAGAYYRFTKGNISRLLGDISIPNATCFSPDGSLAYLADTEQQIIWRWPLDDDGAPFGEKEVHIDLRADNLNPDGAVCDVEGYLWNAQWGASRLARYRPDGTLDRTINLPVSQPTCPAFGGAGLTTLYITSAREGLSAEQLEQQPDAGRVLAFTVGVAGFAEKSVRLNGN